jgi:hypothetical protein
LTKRPARQAELGFTLSDGFNEHLDTLEGRVCSALRLYRVIDISPRRKPPTTISASQADERVAIALWGTGIPSMPHNDRGSAAARSTS